MPLADNQDRHPPIAVYELTVSHRPRQKKEEFTDRQVEKKDRVGLNLTRIVSCFGVGSQRCQGVTLPPRWETPTLLTLTPCHYPRLRP